MDAVNSRRHEIRSSLTLDDFVDLNEIGLGRGVLLARIIAGVAIAVSLVAASLGTDVILWLSGALFGVALFVIMSRPGIRWQLSRKTKGVIGTEVVAIVDEDGIEATNAGMTAKVPWSSITRARTNGRTVVLMRDRVIYAWFTLRTLDAVERASVLEIIQRHVPDTA